MEPQYFSLDFSQIYYLKKLNIKYFDDFTFSVKSIVNSEFHRLRIISTLSRKKPKVKALNYVNLKELMVTLPKYEFTFVQCKVLPPPQWLKNLISKNKVELDVTGL